MKIELNEFQLNNLMQFLQRTPLKGSEVEAFVEVVRVLQNPIEEVEKKDSSTP